MQFHDIENPLPFQDNSFDFVHVRDMQSAIIGPWDALIKEIHRILVPGGALQLAEFIYEHTSALQWRRWQIPRSPVKDLERRFREVSRFPHLLGFYLTCM